MEHARQPDARRTGVPSSAGVVPVDSIAGSPAMAVFDGQLFVAFRGNGGNSVYYTSTTEIDDMKNWTAAQLVPTGSAETSESPVMANFNERLFLIYKGVDSDDSMYYTVFDGKSWTPKQSILSGGPKTSTRPAVVAYQNQLVVAYKGPGADEGLYYTATTDGTDWTAASQILPDTARTVEAPALASFCGMLILAHQGTNDNNIYYTIFDGTSWAQEQTIPSNVGLSGTPAFAADSDRNLFVAYPTTMKFRGSSFIGSAMGIASNGQMQWPGYGSMDLQISGSPGYAMFNSQPSITYQDGSNPGVLNCLVFYG